MKSILTAIAIILSTVFAHAQDDRYFDSRKSYSATRAPSYAHKRVKTKVYAQRQHRKRVPVPAIAAYRGENYSPDPVQWAAKSLARATGEVLGGRPSGCPHRFCGCALAIKLFGRQVAGLNLAANWLRFPRAEAAPGMVAARRGHVFQLQAHIEKRIWRVWDANSGGGRIRIHNRSIAGYTIVNPGSRVASFSNKLIF